MDTVVKEQYIIDLQLGNIGADLQSIPDKLLDARITRTATARAVRDIEETLAMASLPLEAEAYTNGKNDAERKTRLKTLQAGDKSYQAAKRHLADLQADLEMQDIEARQLEDKFAALRAIARLEAARLTFLAEG